MVSFCFSFPILSQTLENLGKPIHLLKAEELLLSYETNNWLLLCDLNNKTVLKAIYLERV